METNLVVAGYVFNEDKVLLIHHKSSGLWLPPGGHIDPDENSDDALIRELKEETGLDIIILNMSKLPKEGNVIKPLAVPFDVNLHKVKDHLHCCFFYIAEAKNPEKAKPNKELLDLKWLTRDELETEDLQPDVKTQAKFAFDSYYRLSKTKLVRDHIPDIQEEDGEDPITHIAEDKEYKERLKAKLYEEVKEYLEDENLEELADLLEVIHAIAKDQNIEFSVLEELREKKKKERGGFSERIVLER